jgi:hypothetical protein
LDSLFIGFIAGVFGMAYFVYGKKRMKASAMVAGVLLCVYPYFIDSVAWNVVVGGALLAVPFLVDY